MSMYRSFTILKREGNKLKIKAPILKDIEVLVPTDINGVELQGGALISDISSQLLPYNDTGIQEGSGIAIELQLEEQLDAENIFGGIASTNIDPAGIL